MCVCVCVAQACRCVLDLRGVRRSSAFVGAVLGVVYRTVGESVASGVRRFESVKALLDLFLLRDSFIFAISLVCEVSFYLVLIFHFHFPVRVGRRVGSWRACPRSRSRKPA